jgi:hypothetical protein
VKVVPGGPDDGETFAGPIAALAGLPTAMTTAADVARARAARRAVLARGDRTRRSMEAPPFEGPSPGSGRLIGRTAGRLERFASFAADAGAADQQT